MIERLPMFGLEGKAKIELYDYRSGMREKVDEGKNLFTEFGLESFRRLCAVAIGGQFRKNIYFNEINAAIELAAKIDSDDFGFLKSIFLTDNAAPISAADCVIPGAITGWATREPYLGSDILRGSINNTETYFSSTGLKAVFDFATDRANGTHKSIFWNNQRSFTGYSEYAASEVIPGNKTLARGYHNMVESTDGFFYGAYNNTLYKIDPATYTELTTWALPANATGTSIFDVYNGYCYFCNSPNSTTLYVVNLSDGTSTTKTLPVNGNGYGGAIIGGYLYYPYTTTRVYKYNLSDNTSEYRQVAMPGTGYIKRCGSNLYFFCDSISLPVYAYDYDNNILTNLNSYIASKSYVVNTHTLSNKFFYMFNAQFYAAASTSSNYVLRTYNPAKTHANMVTGRVLDAPVVKNSSQTMKITYTINFL